MLFRTFRPKRAEFPQEGVRVGAGDGLRTRYLDLGKVALYQVSYSRSARGSILPGYGPSGPSGHLPVNGEDHA